MDRFVTRHKRRRASDDVDARERSRVKQARSRASVAMAAFAAVDVPVPLVQSELAFAEVPKRAPESDLATALEVVRRQQREKNQSLVARFLDDASSSDEEQAPRTSEFVPPRRTVQEPPAAATVKRPLALLPRARSQLSFLDTVLHRTGRVSQRLERELYLRSLQHLRVLPFHFPEAPHEPSLLLAAMDVETFHFRFPVGALRFDSVGSLLASADGAGGLRVYDADCLMTSLAACHGRRVEALPVCRWRVPSFPVNDMMWSPWNPNHVFVSSSKVSHAYQVDLEAFTDTTALPSLPGSTKHQTVLNTPSNWGIVAMQPLKSRQAIAGLTRGKHLVMWDHRSPRRMSRSVPLNKRATCLAPLAGDNVLLCGSGDGTVELWDIRFSPVPAHRLRLWDARRQFVGRPLCALLPHPRREAEVVFQTAGGDVGAFEISPDKVSAPKSAGAFAGTSARVHVAWSPARAVGQPIICHRQPAFVQGGLSRPTGDLVAFGAQSLDLHVADVAPSRRNQRRGKRKGGDDVDEVDKCTVEGSTMRVPLDEPVACVAAHPEQAVFVATTPLRRLVVLGTEPFEGREVEEEQEVEEVEVEEEEASTASVEELS